MHRFPSSRSHTVDAPPVGGTRAYGPAKLANILFTREPARRVASAGIVAHAMHPGIVASNFAIHADSRMRSYLATADAVSPEEPAPFATRRLADLGARVIKIERPDEGDFARASDRSVRGESSYFAGNPARVAHRADCNALVAARLSRLTGAAAVALLDEAGVADARVNTVPDLLTHPVLTERQRRQDVDTPSGPIRALLPPTIIDGVEPVMAPVPALGAHTAAILTELGYTAAEIANLRSSRTI